MKTQRLHDSTYHEAAHAVVAVVLGAKRIGRVSASAQHEGHVDVQDIARTASVIVALAGHYAEKTLYPRRRNCHDHGDYENALRDARILEYRGAGAYKFVMMHESLAEDLVARYWSAIEVVAKELLVQPVWEGAAADAMVRDAVRRCAP